MRSEMIDLDQTIQAVLEIFQRIQSGEKKSRHVSFETSMKRRLTEDEKRRVIEHGCFVREGKHFDFVGRKRG